MLKVILNSLTACTRTFASGPVHIIDYFCRLYPNPSSMKKSNLQSLILLALVAVACSTGTNVSKAIREGETAYQAGDYPTALQYYESVIAEYNKEGKSNECPVYFAAADAASELGMQDKAIGYLEQNRFTDRVNGDTYLQLSMLYRDKDNLSKELDALETYLDKYPDGDQTTWVHRRLFEIFIEIEEWDRATDEWFALPDSAHGDPELVEKYFLANRALKNDSICDRLGVALLEGDSENLPALDWMAKKYFWQAEYRYQAELKAYDENRTNRQYNKLLKALDEVSDDFKTSLGYFTTLYDLDPTAQTAKYLGNIYNRLDDKKKAAYYYRLAE